jgi:hypothetical protein
MFPASAWTNGSDGDGLRIAKHHRDRPFLPTWREAQLLLPEWPHPVTVQRSPSFWGTCPELRSADVSRWLRSQGPKFTLHPVSEVNFEVKEAA